VGYTSAQYKRNRQIVLQLSRKCWLCEEDHPPATTADHVVPLSMGGTDELSNLRPAHLSCNSSRQDRMRMRSSLPW
jgi:5-methylcytosine-specific restriction endonuclease McrA